ncbi:unnamed protein product, partial [Nesidiocoris tenuis]
MLIESPGLSEPLQIARAIERTAGAATNRSTGASAPPGQNEKETSVFLQPFEDFCHVVIVENTLVQVWAMTTFVRLNVVSVQRHFPNSCQRSVLHAVFPFVRLSWSSLSWSSASSRIHKNGTKNPEEFWSCGTSSCTANDFRTQNIR